MSINLARSLLSVTIAAVLPGLCPPRSLAQNVILDGTLNPNGRAEIPLEASVYRIREDNGVTAGTTLLFHSFEKFDLQKDQRAVFLVKPTIQNVLARITGGINSVIDGGITIRSTEDFKLSPANLFLINPAGIMLGQNSKLDLGGSFIVSTLNSIQFPNGQFIAARQSDRDALLEIKGDPSGFLASQINPGTIKIESVGLTVQPERSILFVGGNINFENSTLAIVRPDKGRNVEIGGLASSGSVNLTKPTATTFALTYPENLNKADVKLTNSKIQILTGADASITVNARNLTLDQRSELIVGVLGGNNFPNAKAGDLRLNVTDQVSILSGSKVSNEVPRIARGRGVAGEVVINTRRLVVENSLVRSDVFSDGTAGTLKISASESIELQGEFPPVVANGVVTPTGPGGLFAQINQNAKNSQGGNIEIDTPRLQLRDGAKIQTAVFGTGQAGKIQISAQNIDIAETQQPNYFPTAINAGISQTLLPSASAEPNGTGGELVLETNRLNIQGGSVTAASFGQGNSGNITIKGYQGRTNAEQIEVTNSPLELKWPEGSISAANQGTGQAGNISIYADRLLLNSGQIQTQSTSGNGGNLGIQVGQALLMRYGSLISTTAGTGQAGGNGGNLTITIPNGFLLTVPKENNDIKANAFRGSGGSVKIDAQGIYQFVPRSRAELVQLLGPNESGLDPQRLGTNDITAISQGNPTLNGTVNLNTPDIDPSRGLVPLAPALTDPSNQIDQSCAPNRDVTGSRFTAPGKSGLPSQPTDRSSDSTVSRLAMLPDAPTRPTQKTGAVKPIATIIEAQMAVRLEDGKIRFISPDAAFYGASRTRSGCQTYLQPITQ
jgi:filamentous hemagglutinin family protein